ncbi:MAG: ABC transporter ATP-binding protein [Planctomycetota bacterium]
MIRAYLRLFRYVAPVWHWLAFAVAAGFLYAILNAVNFLAIAPVLSLLFKGNLSLQTMIPGPVAGILAGRLADLERITRTVPAGVILGWIIAILLAAAFVRVICGFLLHYLGTAASHRMARELAGDFNRRVVRLPLEHFTTSHTGDLLSRFTYDIGFTNNAATALFINSVREPFKIATYIALLFFIDPELAVLGLVGLPGCVLIARRLGRAIRRGSAEEAERMGRLASRLHETVQGLRIVKAFNREDSEIARFNEENRKLYKARLRVTEADALSSPLIELLTTAVGCLLLWIGGMKVLSGQLSVEQLLAFIAILGSVYDPVRRLSEMYNKLSRGRAGVERICQVMDLPPEEDTPGAADLSNEAARGGVEFEDVRFAYDGGPGILRGISFRAGAGETVALVGESGAGKTTLVGLLPRFYRTTGGRILVGGTEIARVRLASLRAAIGIVSQHTLLFHDSVRANILYGRPDATDDEIIRAARDADAHDFISSLEKGYDTFIGEGGHKLSGGERQRIAIARAILKNPPILILDEATSALDAESERKVQEALDRLVRNRTVFLIAHRFSSLTRADRILVIEGGRLTEEGTHAGLLAKNGVYARLYRLQTERGETPGETR